MLLPSSSVDLPSESGQSIRPFPEKEPHDELSLPSFDLAFAIINDIAQIDGGVSGSSSTEAPSVSDYPSPSFSRSHVDPTSRSFTKGGLPNNFPSVSTPASGEDVPNQPQSGVTRPDDIMNDAGITSSGPSSDDVMSQGFCGLSDALFSPPRLPESTKTEDDMRSFVPLDGETFELISQPSFWSKNEEKLPEMGGGASSLPAISPPAPPAAAGPPAPGTCAECGNTPHWRFVTRMPSMRPAPGASYRDR